MAQKILPIREGLKHEAVARGVARRFARDQRKNFERFENWLDRQKPVGNLKAYSKACRRLLLKLHQLDLLLHVNSRWTQKEGNDKKYISRVFYVGKPLDNDRLQVLVLYTAEPKFRLSPYPGVFLNHNLTISKHAIERAIERARIMTTGELAEVLSALVIGYTNFRRETAEADLPEKVHMTYPHPERGEIEFRLTKKSDGEIPAYTLVTFLCEAI